jgi:hypothetical protein
MTLSQRVAGLAGPDREVDKLIAVQAFGWVHIPPEYPDERYPKAHWKMQYERDGQTITCSDSMVREYTASLDAALTLVPEGIVPGGVEWSVEAWNSNGVHAEHVRASAWVCGAARTYAATPALALASAALSARGL